MLTTRRRLAWVSSLLARSPLLTARISIRLSTPSTGSPEEAASSMRCAASLPSSISWASRRSSSVVSRSTWPISRRYIRTASDVPPSPFGAIRLVRRVRRRSSNCSSTSSPPRSIARDSTISSRRKDDGVSSTTAFHRVVDRDPEGTHRLLDVGQHVAGELDVTEHMGDVLGVHGTRDASPFDQRIPLHHAHTVNRPRRNGRGLDVSSWISWPHRGVRLIGD